MTAARLGEVTGVSESTVVRFAADLGYRGYPGMKKALQEIVRNRLTSVERIEAAESTMDGHDVLKAVLRADINNLQATLDEIDQDYFNQAVDMILSAKHIYIIGMRTSTTLADFLAIYLKLLLDNVTVVKEIAAREVYEQLLRIGEGDLIIGISFPRYSKRTISAMKFARDRGARCLGLTDGKVSPLNEISDVCLYTKSEMVSFLDSLVAPLSLINALIMAVGARDRDAHVRDRSGSWRTSGKNMRCMEPLKADVVVIGGGAAGSDVRAHSGAARAERRAARAEQDARQEAAHHRKRPLQCDEQLRHQDRARKHPRRRTLSLQCAQPLRAARHDGAV